MSKPLNRPMFRMGGSPNTNSGIISGFAQPRKNFNTGSMPAGFVGSQEEDDILAETLGASTTPTPLWHLTRKPGWGLRQLVSVRLHFLAHPVLLPSLFCSPSFCVLPS